MSETIQAMSVGQAKRIIGQKDIRYAMVKTDKNTHRFYSEGSDLLAVYYGDRKELKIFIISKVLSSYIMPYRSEDIKN